jgi:hypothetical protein
MVILPKRPEAGRARLLSKSHVEWQERYYDASTCEVLSQREDAGFARGRA